MEYWCYIAWQVILNYANEEKFSRTQSSESFFLGFFRSRQNQSQMSIGNVRVSNVWIVQNLTCLKKNFTSKNYQNDRV